MDWRATVGDPLPAHWVEAFAATSAHRWTGAPVVFFERTGSTNDVALRLAAEGAPDGTAVVALAQTAGRGRHGRSWVSPPGAGVYFSLVVDAGRGESAAPTGVASAVLALLAAVAAAEGVERSTGLSVQIKWPNDLVVEGGREPASGRWVRRKLAGILAEGAVSGSWLRHVVIGIGINLSPTAYPPDAVATSIEAETGVAPDAARVFAEVRAGLARAREAWATGEIGPWLARWSERSPSSRGYDVCWTAGTGRLSGVTEGIDAQGGLIVRGRDGALHHLVAGEVEWV